MHLSAHAVRRPIATTMLLFAFALLGVVSLSRLEVTLLPEIRAGSLVVWVPYAEAGVAEIEEALARPVEEVLMGAPGVQGVRSRIVPGGASFTVDLYPGTDPDLAALGIRERLDRVRWTFPDGVARPVLLGGVGESEPVMVLALASEDLVTASDWAESVLAPRLEQIDGVARAHVIGKPEPEIRVLVDPDRMSATGIDVAELASAIRAADVDTPGGTLRRHGIRYSLQVESRLATAADVAEVLAGEPGGASVRVGDVADVEEGFEDPRGWNRLDGDQAVGILLYREAGKNLLRVAEKIHEELGRVRTDFPDLALAVVSDPTPFVRQSITGVWQAVWIGGLLAFGVLFAFLRDARSPLFLMAALPVSVITTFAVLDLAGVSLNLMSLGGIALGVGMLVDNSIVCLENIARLRSRGLSAADAAARGAKEISLPILASTLTTCAVFVPLVTVPGSVGELFRDQAIAVAVSLLVSLTVALTLLPMLCARFPPPVSIEMRLPLFDVYHRLLAHCLGRPRTFFAVVAAGLAVSVVVLTRLPREVLPTVATDQIGLALQLPEGSDVTTTDAAVRRVETWLLGREEVASVFASVGAVGSLDPGDETRRLNRASLKVSLSALGVSRREMLLGATLAEFANETDWNLEVVPEMPELASLLGTQGATLTFDVAGPDAARAEELAAALAARVDAPLRLVASEREPRIRLTPREEALWRYGISEEAALAAIAAATSGYEVTRLARFDREIPIVIHTPGGAHPSAMNVLVAGRSFPVSELFEVGTELAPASLRRENQARVASVRWEGPLREVAPVLAALERACEDFPFPDGYAVTVGGAYRELRETLSGVLRAFALSAGLVLLILAAQFESLRLPFVIFAAVPLALVGVAVVLFVTGGTVNTLSGIGLVVLVGIVVNDSILKVDLLKRLRQEGMPRTEAIFTAGRYRYRPILMTTLTTALGLAPLFFGRGAELRAPLAATLIGGLVSATFLTLLVVPLLFDRIAGEREGAAP